MSAETARLVLTIMQTTGQTQAELADEIKVAQSTVTRWLAGSDPRHPSWQKIITKAGALGLLNGSTVALPDAKSLSYVKTIPVSGYIGAGAEVLYQEAGSLHEEVETVDVPTAWGNVQAFKVRGESMFPAYNNGDTLCIVEYAGDIDALDGKDCIVETARNGRLLKTLFKTRTPGRYDLLSHNAPPMRGVELLQAVPVKYVIKA